VSFDAPVGPSGSGGCPVNIQGAETDPGRQAGSPISLRADDRWTESKQELLMTRDHVTSPGDGALPGVIRAMNDVWCFHQFWDLRADVVTRCLAFVVDDRYLLDPEPGERIEQLRVGASFGENPFPIGMRRGFLSPEPLPSKYFLGLHFIATDGPVIRLYDMWSGDAERSFSDAGALVHAKASVLTIVSIFGRHQ
jgi:hypothetical protein